MCNCTQNFVGDTPYWNKPLNTFNGTMEACNGMPCSCKMEGYSLPTYQQSIGVTVDGTGQQVATNEATASTQKSKTNLLETFLPYADKIFGIERPAGSSSTSSVSTDPDPDQEQSSMKILWWSIGTLVVLILLYVLLRKKKGA